MTIKELYEKAVSEGTENFTIKLQYQDSQGFYDGSCDVTDILNDKSKKEVTLG